FQRKFYDLGKVNYWGPQSKDKVNFRFDHSRRQDYRPATDWESAQERADRKRKERAQADGLEIKVCGGGREQLPENQQANHDATV
ncbi:MAG: magnesium-protoporphyrin IX monomethyl ester cyclase, partial [Pseudomonadota bacterium]